MAHITYLKIQGLSGKIEPLNFTLDRYLNVFYGVNGSGKTSLLKIINSAMKNDASLVEEVYFNSARLGVYSINKEKEFNLECKKDKDLMKHEAAYVQTLVSSGEESGVRFIGETSKLKWKAEKGYTPLSHVYLDTDRLSVLATFRNSTSHENVFFAKQENPNEIFLNYVKNNWTSYYSSVQNEINAYQEKGIIEILTSVINPKVDTEISVEEAYKTINSFFKRKTTGSRLNIKMEDFQNSFDSNKSLKSIALKLAIVEQEIEKVISPQKKILDLMEKLFMGRKKVELKFNEIRIKTLEDEIIPLFALSAGEKQILILLLAVLVAEENTILIDEPELSLHINWQSELIEDFKILNPKMQLIIATHSPEIMANVPEKNIFRLS